MNKYAYDLIKSSEGCNLKAYKDPVGILTIGYGHTGPEVKEGLVWTPKQAEASLMTRIVTIENDLAKILKTPQNDYQIGALIDFAYNVGLGALRNSTLLELINKQEKPEIIAEQFLKWNKAKGKILPGLVTRRQAEHDLYLT